MAVDVMSAMKSTSRREEWRLVEQHLARANDPENETFNRTAAG